MNALNNKSHRRKQQPDNPIDTTIVRKVENNTSANRLRDMFDNETLCDVTIFGAPRDGDDGTNLVGIRAHKSVLASASKHLLDLFTSSGYIDSHTFEHTFENIPHDILQDVVKLLYAFKLDMGGNSDCIVDRTREILIAANYLFIADIVDACDNLLSDILQLNVENYVSTWNFARKFGAFRLMEASSGGIAENLEKVMQQKDFLNLPVNDVSKLLLSEAVIAANAELRCRAALAWINYVDDTGSDRTLHVRDILNMVPINSLSISRDMLVALSESDVVWKGAPEFLRTMFRNNLKHHGPDPYVLRQTAGYEERNAWFVLGGLDRMGTQFFMYDVRRMRWETRPQLPWGRRYSSVCGFRDRIVVMGGRKNGHLSADIDEYNIATASWSSTGQTLGSVLQCYTTCSDGKRAFVFGGSIARNVIRTVESYDVSTKTVSTLASLPVGRLGATATYASATHGAFLVGGLNESFEHVLCVGHYCIRSDCWLSVGKLATPRYFMATALLGDDLYITGGKHDDTALPHVEIFNIHRGGTPRSGPNLTEARAAGSAVALDRNILCVIGGESGENVLVRTVECFDKREGKWSTKVIPKMPQGASFFGFASV